MEDFQPIILGWVLGATSGLLSPLIIDWLKAPFQARSLAKAITLEAKETRYRLTLFAYLLKTRYDAPDRSFVTWAINKFESYDGPEKKPDLEAIRKIEAAPNELFEKLWGLHNHAAGLGTSLKKIPTSFLDTNLHRIELLPIKHQAQLHTLRNKISTLNEQISNAKSKLNMTFDSSLSSENHKLISRELVDEYKTIGAQCRLIADMHDGLIETKPRFWF